VLQDCGKFFRGNVVLCWASQGGVSVWEDVIVEEKFFFEVYKFVNVNFKGAGVGLFDHIPKLFGFIFQDVWELELEFGSLSFAAVFEKCIVYFCACVFFTVSSFGLFVLGSR
jgi:hypothetical protein